MSWTCPHQRSKDDYCERLHQPCKPLGPGCVLAGKFKRVEPAPAPPAGETAPALSVTFNCPK
ncbi:MAG: hypothetical protein R6X19_06720 [Kiritimatiellia bacterium]